MKPAPFAYEAPETLDEALGLLAEHGSEASVLAGGQSLIPVLNFRLARPRVVVDVNRLPGLAGIDDRDAGLALGALARTSAVERHGVVAARQPALRQALTYAGHPQIRNRSTVGGNVAHADPASELPTVLVAFDAEVTLASTEGERVVRARDFFLGPYTTARRADELVTGVRLPAPPLAATFVEVARRHGDYALVGACVALSLADGTVRDARIALCGAAPAPLRALRAEATLAGHALEPDLLGQVAREVADEVEPWDDIHATAAYRRHVAGTIVRRALATLGSAHG